MAYEAKEEKARKNKRLLPSTAVARHPPTHPDFFDGFIWKQIFLSVFIHDSPPLQTQQLP